MFRKRFPLSRIARILGWTGVATAWATVGIRVAAGNPAETAPEPAAEPSVTVTATVPAPGVPDMPDGGLVVIRYTPEPDPEPLVVTRVVEQRVVVQQAPNPTSSGS